MSAANHFVNKHDFPKIPTKYVDPLTLKIGWVDNFGNFLIELPDHHVYIDDRGFFSKIMWTDKHKVEKDSRIEGFSKLQINHYL